MTAWPQPTNDFHRPQAALLTVAVIVLHIAANVVTPYEYHRDEFLYVAMGEHLRFWRMDFPPFIALVSQGTRLLLGDSIAALRLGPAFSHAALTWCAAYSAALLGGRRSAQSLAALAVVLSPLYMRSGNLFQPVTFDQLWWTLALLALMLRISEDNPKHWVGVGLFLGLGLLTKFSIAFIGIGMLLAVVLTPLRRDLLTRWPWVALLIAMFVGHPSITGQVLLGWPVRGQLQDLQSGQLARVGALDFLAGQLLAGPIVLMALCGLCWLLLTRPIAKGVAATPEGHSARAQLQPTHDMRAIGIATLGAFVLLLLMHGKAYYIGPIYPVLGAAGAVVLDKTGRAISVRRPTVLLALSAAVVAVFGMVALPMGLPILAPSLMSEYSARLGVSAAVTTNRGARLSLPQDYADMLGWQALTDTVTRVWNDLSPEERAVAVIIGDNYGEAGAVDLLGRRRGLPPVIAAVGSYWFFGPGNRRGDVAIVVGDDVEDLKHFFREVREVTRTYNPMGVPEEQSVPIHLCRGPLRSLAEVWPTLSGNN